MKSFFLNLQQVTIVIRPSCWHQNFGPNGLSAHTLGLFLNFFSSITAGFNISSALILMTYTWPNAINNGNRVGCFLVDFRKAFDLVDHKLLFQEGIITKIL